MISIQDVPDDTFRRAAFCRVTEATLLLARFHLHSWPRPRTSWFDVGFHIAWRWTLPALAFVLAAGSSGAAPAKWYLDMERGNPGEYLTAAHLNPPATHGSRTNWSTRSGSDDPTMYSMRVDAGNEQRLYSPLSIAGVVYSDAASTRSFSSWNDRDNHYVVYRVPPLEAEVTSGQPYGQSRVSMGCFVRLHGLRGFSYGSYDLAMLHGGGQFAVLNLDDGTAIAGRLYLRIHTRNGVGERIEVYPEKAYWVTMLSDSTAGLYGRAILRVYDPANWKLVGNESVLDHTGPDPGRQNIHEVRFGRCDLHGGATINPGTAQFYDDLIVDESGVEWPLMPGGTPQYLRICSINQIGTNVDITWIGGQGPFRVQTRASLASGAWADLGSPIPGNSAVIPMSKAGFIRVIGR